MQLDPVAAALVHELFAWYLEARATVHNLALRLTRMGVLTPTGKPRWKVASVRGSVKNPAYPGTASGHRTRIVEATHRKSALLGVGPRVSYRSRPREEGIGVPVPALISLEIFDRVQEKLAQNQQCSARNNTHLPSLLRARVRCGRAAGTYAATGVALILWGQIVAPDSRPGHPPGVSLIALFAASEYAVSNRRGSRGPYSGRR